MKDRRMWVIIGCILVVGIAITSYTSSVVKRTSQEQQVQVLSTDTAKKAIGKEKELQAVPEEVGEKSRGSLQEKEVTGEETALAEDEGAEVQSVETKEESYTERLKKLDSQIQKTREQDTDSNVYSAKTSAETELKMWDGELNAVYNALLEALSQEEALKLANRKRLAEKRESDEPDSSGKTGNGLSYASSMVNQTRERAYELAKRYDELAGKD